MTSNATDGDFEADEAQYLLAGADIEARSHKGSCFCFLCQCFNHCFARLSQGLVRCFVRHRQLNARTIIIGQPVTEKFPPNVIRNQKYNVLTFIPMVLYEQFKFFLNLFFLVMALSQFIPELRIGYLYTYWGPLRCENLLFLLHRPHDLSDPGMDADPPTVTGLL